MPNDNDDIQDDPTKGRLRQPKRQPRKTQERKADARDNPSIRTRFTSDRQPRGRGRPRKDPRREMWRHAFLEEASRRVRVKEEGKLVRVTAYRAVIRSIIATAAKGNSRSQSYFVDMVKWIDLEAFQSRKALAQEMIEFREEWRREVERQKETGQPGPKPPIDLDSIRIDPDTMEVTFPGRNEFISGAPSPTYALIKFVPDATIPKITGFLELHRFKLVEGPMTDGMFKLDINPVARLPSELAAAVRQARHDPIIEYLGLADDSKEGVNS